MPKLMAIDPGLQGTGFAIWNDGTTPREVGVLRGPAGPDWMKRVDAIAVQVSDLVHRYKVKRIICEQMESYNTASSSMAWGKGDLQRTVFLIGTIHGMTRIRVKRFELVTPRVWKGQTGKQVTIHRVHKRLGRETCRQLGMKTHAYDAVGIGLWSMGLM